MPFLDYYSHRVVKYIFYGVQNVSLLEWKTGKWINKISKPQDFWWYIPFRHLYLT